MGTKKEHAAYRSYRRYLKRHSRAVIDTLKDRTRGTDPWVLSHDLGISVAASRAALDGLYREGELNRTAKRFTPGEPQEYTYRVKTAREREAEVEDRKCRMPAASRRSYDGDDFEPNMRRGKVEAKNAADEVTGNLTLPLNRMLQYNTITLKEYNAIMKFVRDLLAG